MLRKKILVTSLIMASFGASAGTHSFDARSTAMGGIGASSADYLTAAFHNPALVARYKDSDNVGLLLPYLGAQIQDPDNIVDQIEDFSAVYDNLGRSTTPEGIQADIEAVLDSLTKMQGDSAYVQVGIGGAIAIPNEFLSFNIYTKIYADAFVLADVSDNDLDYDNYLNPNYNLESQGITLGVSITEFGVALAKHFEMEKGTFYVGLTPKYQQVNTINYSVDINNYEFDDFDNDNYQNEDSNFNADIGVAYAMDQGFVFGLVGKNLIEKEYSTIQSVEGVKATYVINPVYTASVSFNHSLFSVGMDVDLNENERYKDFNGLKSGDIKDGSDNTQMAGIGAEFNAWDWAQARIGYQYDIAGTLEDQITAGLGFSPFGVHLDIAGTYSGDNQFGAALQTAFTF